MFSPFSNRFSFYKLSFVRGAERFYERMAAAHSVHRNKAERTRDEEGNYIPARALEEGYLFEAPAREQHKVIEGYAQKRRAKRGYRRIQVAHRLHRGELETNEGKARGKAHCIAHKVADGERDEHAYRRTGEHLRRERAERLFHCEH